MPIEIELCKKDIEEPSGSDVMVNVEEIVTKMNEMRKAVFQKAEGNIKKAQAKYKEYYDEKRQNPQVNL